jgi:hypothetical protein
MRYNPYANKKQPAGNRMYFGASDVSLNSIIYGVMIEIVITTPNTQNTNEGIIENAKRLGAI